MNNQVEKEIRVYGWAACLSIFEQRPEAIRKVYLSEKSVSSWKGLLKYCAERHIAYKVRPEKELAKVAGTMHHEGICFDALPKANVLAESALQVLEASERAIVVYLDGVGNPHNIGAIVRLCAHFGVRFVLGEGLPEPSGALIRVASGGAEFVDMVQVARGVPVLTRLVRAGFKVVGTSSHLGVPLYECTFGPKLVLVLGSEHSGVSAEIEAACTDVVTIPGSGQVESLNVGQATSILLSEAYRQGCQ